MFESREQLAGEILGLLQTLREVAGGDEACLLEPRGLLFETEPRPASPLSEFLRSRCAALFSLPEGLAGDDLREDLFAAWEGPSLLLAFINRRVAMALSCPDAQEAEGRIGEPLRALVDRLLRFDPRYRLDPQGRGLFVGRPRLDVVHVGPAEERG